MTTPDKSDPVYTFGEFTLDTGSGVLSKDGEAIRLRPKSFGVLRFLVENEGRLVTKEALFEAVWGDTVVTDGSITQCLIDVRRALGDRNREAIRTVPRRGYVFSLPVTEKLRRRPANPAPAPAGTRPGRWAPAAGLVLALALAAAWWGVRQRPVDTARPSSGPPAIAVLPFREIGSSDGNAYLADGVAEEILNLLARTPDLRVIARSSSFTFRGAAVDIATVADKLHVDYVLEGSVRRQGDEVRVGARLVDASTSSSVWSQIYDRRLDDVFEVRNDIASAVASSLRVELSGAAAAPAGIGNIEAYEPYLQARFFYNRRAPGDLDRAEAYFRQALQVEPGLSAAWSGLAGIFFIRTVPGQPDGKANWRKFREAIDRALELDPANSDAHMRAAQYAYYGGDFEAARDHRRQAEALDPNNLLVLGVKAGELLFRGRLEEALEAQQRAVALDPLSFVGHANYAYFLTTAGDYEQARREHVKALELNPAYAGEYETALGFLLLLEGRFDEALESARRWPDGADRNQAIALACSGLGRQAEADAALARLIAWAEDPGPSQAPPGASLGHPYQRVAEVHAQRGEFDDAFAWLGRVPDDRRQDETFSASTDWLFEIRSAPLLAPLHADPRWAAYASAATPEAGFAREH